MVMDLPPQTEVVADIPETSDENKAKEFNFTDYSGYVGEPFETDSSIVVDEAEKLNQNADERADGRIEIDLKKTSHTYSGISHITGVSHSGGPYTAGSGYDHKETKRTSTTTKTAQETIDDYSSRMRMIADKSALLTDLVQYVELHNFYTKGVVAINPDGTEAYSEKGTKEQIEQLKIKAEERARALLNGKSNLISFEGGSSIDNFATLLPEKLKDEFLANRKALEDRKQSGLYLEKQPEKKVGWFKRLFNKSSDKKVDNKQTASVKPEKKSWFARLFSKKDKSSTVAQTPEKPWHQSFQFNTEKPMESIKEWCEKVGNGKMEQSQYQEAQEKLPPEYRKVAAHIQVWYRGVKDRKDFDWSNLPANRAREFVDAKETYAKNLETKRREALREKSRSSNNTRIADGYKGIRAAQEHRAAMRRAGLGGGFGRF